MFERRDKNEVNRCTYGGEPIYYSSRVGFGYTNAFCDTGEGKFRHLVWEEIIGLKSGNCIMCNI